LTIDEKIVEVEYIEEDQIPEAKPKESSGIKDRKRLSKSEFTEARWRAQNWAIQEEERKNKERQTHN
jgi:hypothetical protein